MIELDSIFKVNSKDCPIVKYNLCKDSKCATKLIADDIVKISNGTMIFTIKKPMKMFQAYVRASTKGYVKLSS